MVAVHGGLGQAVDLTRLTSQARPAGIVEGLQPDAEDVAGLLGELVEGGGGGQRAPSGLPAGGELAEQFLPVGLAVLADGACCPRWARAREAAEAEIRSSRRTVSSPSVTWPRWGRRYELAMSALSM